MLFDRIRRAKVAHEEVGRMGYRWMARCEALPQQSRMYAQFKMGEQSASSCPSRISRRCIITGRGKSIIDEFNITRQRFREMACNGELIEIKKSSW